MTTETYALDVQHQLSQIDPDALRIAGVSFEVHTYDVLPPVIVDLASADGTTVTVAVGGVVDLTGGGDDVAAWSAEVADPAVVSFTPGRDDGSATFNPGLTGLAEGSSEVTLTNGAGGDTVTLTVDVTAG